MVDDVHAFRERMAKKGAPTSEVHEERWGSLVNVEMPGGGKIGVYQPKHASPIAAKVKAPKGGAAKAKSAGKSVKRAAGKKSAKNGAKTAKTSAAKKGAKKAAKRAK